jgi:hypothetical protein
MITIIRFFKEKTDEDYQQYAIEWDNNKNRIIFLQNQLSTHKKQLDSLLYDLQSNPTKDIFAIRFLNPNKNIFNNEIVKKILSGEGITYNNGVWLPSEFWIYN